MQFNSSNTELQMLGKPFDLYGQELSIVALIDYPVFEQKPVINWKSVYRVEVANSRHPRELLDGERLASLGSSKGGGVIAQLGKFVIVDVESDKYETFPPDCLVAIDAEELLINTTAWRDEFLFSRALEASNVDIKTKDAAFVAHIASKAIEFFESGHYWNEWYYPLEVAIQETKYEFRDIS